MLNIRTLKVDSVYMQLLISFFILITISCPLMACSNNSDDIVNRKIELEGFILQLEMNEKFKEDEEITFKVGIYQELSSEVVDMNFNSHLIDFRILDSDNNELYSMGHEDRVYQGTIGSDKSVLSTISPVDPNLKTLPKGEYTVVINSTFLYKEKEIILELSEGFIVK